MINVKIKAMGYNRTHVMDVCNTPAEAFDMAGVSISGSTVNVDGQILDREDLNTSFAELGFEVGASVSLNAIIKADGGR